jgi:hypothetical protein
MGIPLSSDDMMIIPKTDILQQGVKSIAWEPVGPDYWKSQSDPV